MKGNVFIKRPVMAISISVLILAIGLISLFTLPVEQYPDIAPPTVYVTASYTGADAEAVMNSVIMPLEESINGVEDMMYIVPVLPMQVWLLYKFILSRAQTPIWRQSTCKTVWRKRRDCFRLK